MKDIEDRLKEEYDKVEVPDYMFDTSRVFKRIKKEKKSSKKIVIASVASIIVILMIVLLIIFIPKTSNNDNLNIQPQAESNEITIAGKIDLNENYSVINIYNKNSFILIIRAKMLEDYKIIDNIPYTKIKAEVLNSYLGNASNEIEMYVPGGIFKVKDLKEKVKLKDSDVTELSKYNDEDYLEVTYYNEVYIPIAKENGIYITTLSKIDEEYFVKMEYKYNFKEFNPETNIVKDDTGDEPLQIDKYLENITK